MDLFVAVFDAVFIHYVQSDILRRHRIQSQSFPDLLFLFIGKSGFGTALKIGLQPLHPMLIP